MGHSQDCDSLLAIGANVDWKNTEGQGRGDTPLLAACRRGHDNTVDTLLVAGADVNISGADGRTPLMVSADRGDHVVLNKLLDCSNLDINAKDKDGNTAYDIARMKGLKSVCARLAQCNGILIEGDDSNGDGGDFNDTSMKLEEFKNGADVRSDSKERKREMIGGERPSSSSSQPRLPTITPQYGNNSGNNSRVNRGDTGYRSTSPVPLTGSGGVTSGYSIINHNVDTDKTDEAAVVALRTILDQEQKKLKKALREAEEHREKNNDLKSEVASLKLIVDDMENERESRQEALDFLQGRGLQYYNMNKCEQLEQTLRSTLDAVEARKKEIIKESQDVQNEQRLCVICCHEERTIVLLPCRHLCLCGPCSEHESLRDCPLCRKPIQHKFSVFS